MFVCILTIQHNYATILECDFKVKSSHWGVNYACVAINFKTSLTDRNVSTVNGRHLTEKSNEMVTKLYAEKQFCPYLPLNLSSHFKNLETLYIMKSNVQHLLDGDLDELTNLKVFDVSHNPIEQLGRNFFRNQRKIETISFYDCHLKIIDPKSLDPLINLQEAHFQINVCIDYYASEESMLNDLKAEIGDKCTSELYNERIYNQINNSLCNCNQTVETLSFTRRNTYVMISCLGVVITVLIAVLVRIILRKNLNSWHDVRATLL